MTRRKKISIHSINIILRLQQCLTSNYSHSSSEFFQPSTPDHMNTQQKKALAHKFRYIWPYLGMPCSQFAKSLPFFKIPKLIGEGMQRKIWDTGNWQEGNILLLFSWLATCRKIKSSIQMTSYWLLWCVQSSGRLLSKLLGILHGCSSNSHIWLQLYKHYKICSKILQSLTEICLGNRKDAPNNLQCYFCYDTFCTDVKNCFLRAFFNSPLTSRVANLSLSSSALSMSPSATDFSMLSSRPD